LFERAERDTKHVRHRAIHQAEIIPEIVPSIENNLLLDESKSELQFHRNNLQNRASAHLEAIINQLVDISFIGKISPKRGDSDSETMQNEQWKNTIASLVREVVSSVDPNVRKGDSLDIEPYVKVKLIPGGSIEECVYVDGVVFRKTVSHKKMMGEELKHCGEESCTSKNPKILLLAGGIDFQRDVARMSSLDTLIEQEDRYLEILVEKIMSLKPDIILVGKAVARRAQELLCEYNVAVMQNVKANLLERMSRMTGAMMLPSTDHMIQQYGEECLGSCSLFWLRYVQDNPEKLDPSRPQRVLKSPITRGSTYTYFSGCPPELGCTLVLRGANRQVLTEIKRIIKFAVVLAYHLRLEVAYYSDRFAQLPACRENVWYGDDSDDDDYNEDNSQDIDLQRSWRYLLSTSLDVDIRLPYRSEVRGLPSSTTVRSNAPPGGLKRATAQDHQTLLVTSMLMGMGEGREGKVQNSRAQIMGIRFYSTRDMALGQFLVENCFQMHNTIHPISLGGERKDGRGENSMLDQTLTYAHRPGRVDITVHRIGDSSTGMNIFTYVSVLYKNKQIYVYIYV
jgi:hypothetical protein